MGNADHRQAKCSENILNFFNDAPNVTFYIIDKNRNYIYKNKALAKIVGDSDKAVDQKAWKWSQQVMKTGKEITVEEERNGVIYLSKKSPLIIDGKIEGIIGFSIDITERKKAEQLEAQRKLQKEKTIARNSNRFVKWSEEARKFLDSAIDNSLDLFFIVSHDCKSQTGEGFEDFVNTINKEDVKKKIKKLTIVDASYLYRHSIPAFHQLASPETPSIWFLNNEDMIKRIRVGTEIVSWANLVNSEEYNLCREQIDLDFQEVESFKNIVTNEARECALKKNLTYEGCLEFILEEISIVCTFFKDAIQIYPVSLSDSMLNVCRRYNLNVSRLIYKISKYAQRIQDKSHDFSKIQQEILSLLPSVSGTTSFAIDKDGRYIYKNKALSDVIGNGTLRVVSPKSWEISKKIMRLKKQMTVEEQYLDKRFLSVKAPLIINDKVEGIMGVSIDITDRKRAENLELKNKLQETELKEREKFQEIAGQVSHDIRTPLDDLLINLNTYSKEIPEKAYIKLRDATTRIRKTARVLLEYSDKKEESAEHQPIMVSQELAEIVEQKELTYYGKNIEFQYSFDPSLRFTFIYGNALNFERMMSNIIKNSVEAFDGKNGIVKISFIIDCGSVKITVEDNGKGMPQETVDKLMKGESVSTTKEGGFGVGTGQIRSALAEFGGTQLIRSTPNVGTQITLTIPRFNEPKWVMERLCLHKGEMIVILDDDVSIYQKWKERLEKYIPAISLKFFENGQEAIDFINSCPQKENGVRLLSDYELRGQKLNGLDVIQKCNLGKHQASLVSSVYSRKEIQDKAAELNVTILPKAFIDIVPIDLDEKLENDMSFVDTNVILIDDNKSYANTMSDFLRSTGLVVDTYYDPKNLMINLSKYNVNTKIITDNCFDGGMDGDALVHQLWDRGFRNVCVLTGYDRKKVALKYPLGTDFVLKGEEGSLDYILSWCKDGES